MMLLVGTGSLVVYTPANVETQPIQQPQQPQQPQKPQSQLGPQTHLGALIMPKSKMDLAQTDIMRAIEDRKLLDRLMPQIIDRIKVTLNFRDNYSPLYKVSKDILASDSFHNVEARCPPELRVEEDKSQPKLN
jgi:hypothetical protein